MVDSIHAKLIKDALYAIRRQVVFLEGIIVQPCEHRWLITCTPYAKDGYVIREYACDVCRARKTETAVDTFADLVKMVHNDYTASPFSTPHRRYTDKPSHFHRRAGDVK